MTTALLARTAFRLWGAWILVWTIASAPQTYLTFSYGNADLYSTGLVVLSPALQIAFGLALIRFAPNLADRLFPVTERLRFKITAEELQESLLLILGFLFLIEALTTLVPLIDDAVNRPEPFSTSWFGYVLTDRRETLWSLIVVMSAGLFLVRRKLPIAAVWAKLHPMGQFDDDDPAGES